MVAPFADSIPNEPIVPLVAKELIISCMGHQRIVALPTQEDIVATPRFKIIVALAAIQRFIVSNARGARIVVDDPIVALSAAQLIDTSPSEPSVVPITAD